MNVTLAPPHAALARLFVLLAILSSLAFSLSGAVPALAEPAGSFPLYGLFETKITNSKSYSNPYDYHVIELQGEFTSPSSKKYSFTGFFDGDGNGGLTGNVWRLRFMPNETGHWTYTYSWSDGTPGGAGSFDVTDTGLPGPLRLAQDNSWYYETARGSAFHWRGYSLHRYLQWIYGRGIFSDAAWDDLRDKIGTKVAGRKYNAVMLRWPTITRSGEDFTGNNAGHHFWQQNGSDINFTRFYIPQWRQVERTLQSAADDHVYVFQFVAMVDQYTPRPNDTQMDIFLRYMASRLGPYWNNFGYSVTWEYQDLYSNSQVNSFLNKLHDSLKGLPNHSLLTIHDHSDNDFTAWMDFSMRQQGSTTVFEGNCRTCGQHGGIESSYVNKPIIASEDIWEMQETSDTPKNGEQVRRGAWGILLAGGLPVYLEETGPSGTFEGEGQPEVQRMWDFFFSKTQYRKYTQQNSLVSSANGQVCSGITGKEYLVYDETGGSISINLSAASSSTTFSVLWYNPANGSEKDGGTIQGGASRTLSSPFSGDTVLLLRETTAPPTATATNTATAAPTATKTATATATATTAKTNTAVPTATKTASSTATKTPDPTPTATKTPAAVPTATKTPQPTATPPATKTTTPITPPSTATQPSTPTGTPAPEPPQPPAPTPTANPTLPPTPQSVVRINFQPDYAQVPESYLPDDGSPFSRQDNGFSYGWNVDNHQNARERNEPSSPDQVHDTFNHMQQDGTYQWEIELPDGTYRVRAISGDPKYFDGYFHLLAENETLLEGAPTKNVPWLEGILTVYVGDGRLTLSNGANAINNKINLIEIEPATPELSLPYSVFLPQVLKR